MSGYPDDVPNCPTCKIPLRLKHLDDGRGWAVWCVKGTTMCEFRPSRLFRPTKLEAIAAWLDPNVNQSNRRFPRGPRKRRDFGPLPVKFETLGEPCPRCHLRGQHECMGDIHQFIRSGLPAGGAINLR